MRSVEGVAAGLQVGDDPGGDAPPAGPWFACLSAMPAGRWIANVEQMNVIRPASRCAALTVVPALGPFAAVFATLPLAAGCAVALLGGCAVADDGDLSARTIGELPVGELRREVAACADGATVAGIDVSYWQGAIDWSAVAGAGIDFAIARVSHGLGTIDTRFDANWAGIRANGLVRGAYQYFEPTQDALAQANLLIDLMGPLEPGDLPPVLDLEEADGRTPAELSEMSRIWLTRVEEATGRKPMIYTGKYFWRDSVGSLDFGDNPLWIAQWGPVCPDLPAPWTRWAFHQTSATGRVAGISGDVDTNLFNGSLADLMAFGVGESVCGDGSCGSDESYANCPSDCPRCEPVPLEGRVIDEEDRCTTIGGAASGIRSVTGTGWDGDLKWTYATDWAAEDNFIEWTLDLAADGRYAVEAYTAAPYGGSRRAAYQVRHAGQDETILIDQTAQSGWARLGEFDFAAGGDQHVHLGDNTGEALSTDTQIALDAVRLTRVGGGPGTDAGAGAGADAGPSGGDGGWRPDEPPGAPSAFCTVSTARAGGTGTIGTLLCAALVAASRLARRRARSCSQDRRPVR